MAVVGRPFVEMIYCEVSGQRGRLLQETCVESNSE